MAVHTRIPALPRRPPGAARTGLRGRGASASVMNLHRLAGNAAVSDLLARQPAAVLDSEEQELEVTPASVAKALAEARVTRTEEKVTGYKPWEIFRHAIGNNQTKKKLYSALKSAGREEQKARVALATAKEALAKAPDTLKGAKLKAAVPRAQKALEAATKRTALAQAALKEWVKGKVASWSPDPGLNELEQAVAECKRRLAALRKVRRTDAAAIKAAQAEYDAVAKRHADRVAQLKREVDATPFEAGEFTRTRYSITVGDATVNLYDHVEAYATIIDKGLEGSARLSGAGQTVDQLVDADKIISRSTKKIIKLVSSFEGRFSSVNTWDQADVTWGFISGRPARTARAR